MQMSHTTQHVKTKSPTVKATSVYSLNIATTIHLTKTYTLAASAIPLAFIWILQYKTHAAAMPSGVLSQKT